METYEGGKDEGMMVVETRLSVPPQCDSTGRPSRYVLLAVDAEKQVE